MDKTAHLPGSFRAATSLRRADASSVERSLARDAAHGAVLAIAWALVLVLWVRVLRGTSPRVLLLAGGSVVACAVVSITVTRWWIAHNVAIHRAKGPRTGVPVAPLDYGRDWVGRAVTGDWSAVKGAGVVVICASDSRKVFLPDPSVGMLDDVVGAAGALPAAGQVGR